MGRRSGSVTKKINQGSNDDVQFIDQIIPSSIAKHGAPKAMTELTQVAVVESRSLEEKKPTRRSRRLQNATFSPQVFGIQSELGHVDVLELEGAEGSGKEADPDFPQSPDVEKKDTEDMERLFKLVKEQQRRIDELAAGKRFSSQDPSEDVISLEAKVNKYKNMYVDAQKKIRRLQKKTRELSKKVACANAKLEGYEKGQQIFCGLIDSIKDASLFASLARSTETLLELPATGNTSSTRKRSTQTKDQAAKRKKVSDL